MHLIPGDTGLTVVRNGDSVFIPEDGTDIRRKPCRIIVNLIGVRYAGDNVGSQWRFEVAIDGQYWNSGTRSMAVNNWLPIGEKVYDEVKRGGCGLIHPMGFFVRARELDWFIFDDIGAAHRIVSTGCTEEGTNQWVFLPVSVREYPSFFFPWIFRRFRKTAQLLFYFSMEAKCVT